MNLSIVSFLKGSVSKTPVAADNDTKIGYPRKEEKEEETEVEEEEEKREAKEKKKQEKENLGQDSTA